MGALKVDCNRIPGALLMKWRRDIVGIPPVIKINSKGENLLGHTAPFPREIPNYAVRVFTGKGETVLDPFAGSFTAPIEAAKLGRNGVGIEINKDMFRSSIVANAEKHLPMSPLFAEARWAEYDCGHAC